MELIIDIETVSGQSGLDQLSADMQGHWERKAMLLRRTDEEPESAASSYFSKAGIYAEFGKIICIGIGLISREQKHIRIKTLANDDEQLLLRSFIELILKMENEHKVNIIFCGHNIKEFDLPYICRRLMVNGLTLPRALQLAGLKPWQVSHQDTLDLWRYGDHKHYTSLDLLARVLDVPSSKTDIDGSEVNGVYWNENDLDRIATYCSRDIFTTALVYLRLKGESIKGFEPVQV